MFFGPCYRVLLLRASLLGQYTYQMVIKSVHGIQTVFQVQSISSSFFRKYSSASSAPIPSAILVMASNYAGSSTQCLSIIQYTVDASLSKISASETRRSFPFLWRASSTALISQRGLGYPDCARVRGVIQNRAVVPPQQAEGTALETSRLPKATSDSMTATTLKSLYTRRF